MADIEILPAMVRIYANLIKNGAKTLEEIPEPYRQPVKDYLGWD